MREFSRVCAFQLFHSIQFRQGPGHHTGLYRPDMYQDDRDSRYSAGTVIICLDGIKCGRSCAGQYRNGSGEATYRRSPRHPRGSSDTPDNRIIPGVNWQDLYWFERPGLPAFNGMTDRFVPSNPFDYNHFLLAGIFQEIDLYIEVCKGGHPLFTCLPEFKPLL